MIIDFHTSMILPAVIKKIAELKGISSNEIERMATRNTISLFNLPIMDREVDDYDYL